MKKFAIGLLSTAAVIGFASAASAQSSGWYAGIMGGASWLQDSDVTGSGINTPLEFGTGWAALGAVGYDFGRFNFGGLRAEGELSWRAHSVDTAGNNGDVSAMAMMVNGLYDLPINFPVRPYLGVGVGAARVNFDDTRLSSTRTLDSSDMAFAYQGIVGLGWDINPSWRLNLDYRYFATLDLNLKTTSVPDSVETEYKSHNAMLGLVYKFGAPAPAPAPMPVAAPAPAPTPVVAPAPAPAPVAPKNFIVFFDFDKAIITPEAMAIIKSAADYSKSGGKSRVELVGHTDRAGSDKYNGALSQKRADAVKTEMAKLGINVGGIATQAKGEALPLVKTDDGVREPQNRRVEIVIP
jgi:OOP family OmpA-OmpF porin